MRSALCLLALTLGACAAPPAPTLQVHSERSAPAATSPGYKVQLVQTADLRGASSNSNTGSAGKAIDADEDSKWVSVAQPRSASLTIALNVTAPVKLAELKLKTDPFLGRANFDVQTSTNGRTYRTVMRNQRNPVPGEITLAFPDRTSAMATHVRIVCHNAGSRRQRQDFGIYDVQVKADLPGTPENPLNFEFTGLTGEIPQYRPAVGRLRFEAACPPGHLGTRDLTNLGKALTATRPQTTLHGFAIVEVDGEDTQTIDVDLARVPGERGVIAGADAQENEIEIIWPALAGELEHGPDPIVRVQLGNAPDGLTGETMKVKFKLTQRDRNGDPIAFWESDTTSADIPAARN